MNGDTIEPGRSHARRSRLRTLQLAEGDKLVLDDSGSIAHIAADGSTKRTWSPDDPEWPRIALRFGLREAPTTVAPGGRRIAAIKPRR